MTNKDKILKAKKHGYFGREIGKFLGISKQAVDQKLTKEEKKMIKAYREAWITNLFES
jgi:predicted DNA binding protein